MSALPAPPGRIIHDEIVAAGRPWWRVVGAGDVMRIVDLDGQQAVDFLCFDAADPRDRYSAANTIKIPAQLYVGRGTVLYSDTVKKLMTVIGDTVGGHDTVFGCCSTENNLARYGVANTPSCRRNFLEAFAALGLDASALVANVNFFMAVPVGADGKAQIVDGASKPGDHVDLRAERDVLVVISNCPQTLNPCNGFEPSPIRVLVYRPA